MVERRRERPTAELKSIPDDLKGLPTHLIVQELKSRHPQMRMSMIQEVVDNLLEAESTAGPL